MRRYFKFGVLILSAGVIYPLLYLRQNFETTILEAFSLSSSDLGSLYSILGVVFFLAYVPSGWLADRFSPRALITFSLAVTGVLGLWFATFPPLGALRFLFVAWGVTTGLTFWASLLKGVELLAESDERGRFFGILDGGRGLVEAVLASAAIALFAWRIREGSPSASALREVIYFYSGACLITSLLALWLLDSPKAARAMTRLGSPSLSQDLRTVLGMPSVWLLALTIFCGYQLFWSTYSFSAFLQGKHRFSAVDAGFITVAKLWMRPVGGITAGFLGDRFTSRKVLSCCLFVGAGGLLLLSLAPAGWPSYVPIALVMTVGIATYAIRGLYWSLFQYCQVPERLTGLAMGFVSMLAYLPDIFLPSLSSWLQSDFAGVVGYQIYFLYIALGGLVGAIVVLSSRFDPRSLSQVPS